MNVKDNDNVIRLYGETDVDKAPADKLTFKKPQYQSNPIAKKCFVIALENKKNKFTVSDLFD